MANGWFRMYAEFCTDPKVQMLSEADQRRFVMLLCMRCSNGDVTLHDDEVAFQLRISNEDWARTKAVLQAKNLITDGNQPTAWEKRQSTDSLRPSSEVWRVIRTRIFERDNYTCQYCGAKGVRLECDHVIPVARGGNHDDGNLVTACFACNRSKHAKTLEQWGGANV